MATIPFDNPYALLALFLSPCKDAAATASLLEAAENNEIDWGSLLYKANIHFCTPLWYVRMLEKGLLPSLPGELQEYLRLLHQANVERNDAFRLALEEILQTFRKLGIRTLLLKGAATFCDDLYEDPGARMMGDLDILIEPQFSESARASLVQLGYEQEIRHSHPEIEIFSGNRHHHLPRFNQPGTPVVVEIHTRLARRQGGRTLPEDLAWQKSEHANFKGLESAVPSPTHRLLHNSVHALVPHREFIRSSIALGHLAEFVAMARLYDCRLDWDEWFRRGASQGLGLEFAVYLELAHRLMDLPLPDCVPRYRTARLHLFRFLAAEKYLAAPAGPSSCLGDKILTLMMRFLVKAYHRTKEPVWLWRNEFYAQGAFNIPLRLAYTWRKWARRGESSGRKTGQVK